MLTESQKSLISWCMLTGYGYAKFAESVNNQGWCSKSQELTMEKFKKSVMERRREYRDKVSYGSRSSRSVDGALDICDYADYGYGEPF